MTAADETQRTLANIDVSAGAVNVLPVEADLGSLYESRSPEAVALKRPSIGPTLMVLTLSRQPIPTSLTRRRLWCSESGR